MAVVIMAAIGASLYGCRDFSKACDSPVLWSRHLQWRCPACCRAERVLEGQHTFALDTLLGRRDDPALTVCARHMAEKLLDAGCTRQARLSSWSPPLLGRPPLGLASSAALVRLIAASAGVPLSVCS